MNTAKAQAYYTDVHIPFLMSGPGIAPGSQMSEAISLIDVAPTLLDIAGVKPPFHFDGKSFLRQVKKGSSPSKVLFHC